MPERDVVGRLVQVVRQRSARIVGLAGPPGAGKSTLARLVADHLTNTLVISLDDFYLSRSERQRAGMKWRGPPGSHDVPALLRVLDQIRSGETPITLPQYSAEIDDRVEPIVMTREPRHVLVEGWVLGHRDDGYGEILDRLDLLVFLDVAEETARIRRFAREEELRAGGGGFSEEDMQRFWDEVLAPGIPRWVRAARESADLVLPVDDG